MPSRREKEWLLAVISRRTTGTPWRAATCRRTDVPHTRATAIIALIDWQCGSFISGLRIFMQFYIFTNVIKKIISEWKFVSTNCYEFSVSRILYILYILKLADRY